MLRDTPVTRVLLPLNDIFILQSLNLSYRDIVTNSNYESNKGFVTTSVDFVSWLWLEHIAASICLINKPCSQQFHKFLCKSVNVARPPGRDILPILYNKGWTHILWAIPLNAGLYLEVFAICRDIDKIFVMRQ